MQGREIMILENVSGQEAINISVLEKGINLVKIEQGGGLSVFQLLKQQTFKAK
jgi:hypothetical protein